MAGLPRDKSRRMYSWWWDSHISPKNSKWLQENLTDMDTKVKAMIKLIEEDADSFARRAEMYYKKRPELMKLVEEFYRAYRALAERYDNATGVLRQAHRTMAEVFPNQMTDDSLESTGSEVDPRTPEMPPSMRSLFGHDGLQKDALGFSSSDVHAVKRNGDYTQVSDSIANSKGMKQFNRFSGLGDGEKLAGGRVRKGLNFHDAEEKGRSMLTKENHIPQDQVLFESEVVSKFEKEIQTLKDALAKLEVEKEAGLSQYQQSLEKLYKLESVVSRAQEDSRGLNDRANKAEGEVQALRETLINLEAEKESSLLQYHKCLERISNLENEISHAKEDIGELNERTHKAEVEAQTLKQDLATTESEKGAALDQYNQSLEMITTLRNKLMLTDEDARKLSEQAVKAEGEVKILNLALAELTKEKEGAALQYQQCLETVSILEHKLSCAENEVQRLKGEIDNGFTKLKSAEEQCFLLEKSNQSLNSELQSLVLKMGSQSEELTEKQKELGRLWACLQEERFRFMEAETAFQTLQHLHSQTQEELRSLALELENRAQLLRDTETRNESLLDEVLKVKEDNKRFNELNLSSAISMKEMQNVIVSLRESKDKLAEEVELRVDQRNALQQEIYCLKEDLNELNKKHQVTLDQVDALGMSPEEFESSVKQLQTDNLDLKENIERERNEKEVLLEKLTIMEQLLEKNAFLEKSLSDLTSELEGARGKINALEESFQALLEEKSTLHAEKATLMSQSQVMMVNLEKLSEKNNCLENSLSDVCDELEGLKARSKSLEDSCQLLEIEKSDLIDEKDALLSQGKTTQQTLEVLEKRQRELEERYSALEKERDSTICKVEELRLLLDVEKQEHVSFSQKRETQLTGMGKQISLLHDELSFRRTEFEEELDKAMHYQLEIFILQRCVQDLKEKNKSLLIECQKLLEASTLSEKLISELKHDNCEQQVEVKSLSDQTSRFRMGMCELLKAFDIDLDHGCEDKFGEDQSYFSHMLCKLEDTKSSLNQVLDENQQLDVEMSVIVTLLGQIKLEAKALKMERDMLDWQFKMKNEQLSFSLIEANKLREMNEDLSLKVSKLTALEIENSELRKIVESLKIEVDEVNVVSNNKEQRICKLSEDNNLLSEENQCVREENRELEVKLHQVHEEHEKTKSREGYLFSEVQLGKNEIEQWESWAASVFGELQVSSIFRALLEEKFHKLADACNLLEEEVTSKDTHIELLKERISTLEGENGGVKAQLAAHVPLIISLKDGISSLENLTWHAKLQKSHAEGVKDAELLKHQDVESCKEVNADQEVPDALSELQDLQDRIKAVEKAVTEAAMRQIEELKYRGSSNQETVKPVSDNSEFENEILMKDIMLDQISESSSYEIIRRGRAKSQSRRVESWDAADPNDSIELTVGKGKKVKSPSEKGNEHPRGEMLKRQKSKYRSSDTVVEKELGVDKLEISRTFSQRRQEVNNTKILERLNSDGQKLTNLQITVQDLKRKIEITEKSKRSKAMYECNTLKEQLEEAEEAILELFDFNGKLTRSAERKSFSSNIRSGGELEESGSSRRRISEQARKMSEKIGRLQLEVQKIQFVLVNYENEKENKGKSRIMEMKRRVLLRDYLYGGARTPSIRRKKSTFCGCVQPPTRGD